MPKHAKTGNDADLNKSNSAEENYTATEESLTEDDFVTPEIVEEGEYPDALDSLVPDVDSGPLYYDSSAEQLQQARADEWGNQGKKNKHFTVYQKKSRRMRRILIVVIILIVVLIGALGYFASMLINEAQNEATQQALSETIKDVDELKESDDASDETTKVTKAIEAPALKDVLGKTEDEAIEIIGHGATEISSTPVEEEGNPVKRSARLSLTDDPSDINSASTPTVYLDLNEEGKIISAGYSAAVSSLGYDISSFADAINKNHVVENTLAEMGISVPEGEVTLPEDKSLYSKYDSTGDKLTSASYSFSGVVEIDGATYDWSAVVRFDYAKANSSGNLQDTVAQIYIYVSNSGLAAEVVDASGAAEGTEAPEVAQ